MARLRAGAALVLRSESLGLAMASTSTVIYGGKAARPALAILAAIAINPSLSYAQGRTSSSYSSREPGGQQLQPVSTLRGPSHRHCAATRTGGCLAEFGRVAGNAYAGRARRADTLPV
jgi:hypothetical protein